MPANYKALELNEALINWFNPMSTYNDVVSAAADEAGGQGFVTELAGDSDTLDERVLTRLRVQQWKRDLDTSTYADAGRLRGRRARARSAAGTASRTRCARRSTLPAGVDARGLPQLPALLRRRPERDVRPERVPARALRGRVQADGGHPGAAAVAPVRDAAVHHDERRRDDHGPGVRLQRRPAATSRTCTWPSRSSAANGRLPRSSCRRATTVYGERAGHVAERGRRRPARGAHDRAARDTAARARSSRTTATASPSC